MRVFHVHARRRRTRFVSCLAPCEPEADLDVSIPRRAGSPDPANGDVARWRGRRDGLHARTLPIPFLLADGESGFVSAALRWQYAVLCQLIKASGNTPALDPTPELGEA